MPVEWISCLELMIVSLVRLCLFVCVGLVPLRVWAQATPAAAGTGLRTAPLKTSEAITVTATRSGVALGAGATTITELTHAQLTDYPALTLDDRLRQHAGFELFRRTSGWVQNPTSQGISLRGLGSTAASRTLVLMDNAPLNDPFGGWIHWNELPPEAISAVTIASGGGSDLYGSSALGGVIDLIPAMPSAASSARPLLMADISEAAQGTTSASGRIDLKQARLAELLAAQFFRTDGYILVAPAFRGPVDVPANVHFETAHLELDHARPAAAKANRAFLLGNVLNEARDNGTPIQTNGTRLWRYLLGDDWAASARISGRVRGFGSDEAYRQSFSAISPARTSERLTREQQIRTQELGGSADATLRRTHVALVAGGDVRDLRATDAETPIANHQPNGLADTSARQRFFGGFVEGLGERGPWSATASLRIDRAENLATKNLSMVKGTATQSVTPNRSEAIFSPRVGLVRRLGAGATVHASGFRAFRTPTMNELYRTGQVGQEITFANANLVSERATGAEAGLDWTPARGNVQLAATYFFTEINRPVSAVLIAHTATTITNERENLGQIQSQGVELSATAHRGEALSATVGYQFADATVTSFSAQPALVGNWIPEVPRNTATAQLRGQSRRFGVLTLDARETGRVYDDSSNIYVLHGFFTLGLYAERAVGGHVTAYVSVENMLNRAVEAARTPVLTLGTPVTAAGGVQLHWGNEGRGQ